jgi:hypothetical protein
MGKHRTDMACPQLAHAILSIHMTGQIFKQTKEDKPNTKHNNNKTQQKSGWHHKVKRTADQGIRKGQFLLQTRPSHPGA